MMDTFFLSLEGVVGLSLSPLSGDKT